MYVLCSNRAVEFIHTVRHCSPFVCKYREPQICQIILMRCILHCIFEINVHFPNPFFLFVPVASCFRHHCLSKYVWQPINYSSTSQICYKVVSIIQLFVENNLVKFKLVRSSTTMRHCRFDCTGGPYFFPFTLDISINICSGFTLAGLWSLFLLALFCLFFPMLHDSQGCIDPLVISHLNDFAAVWVACSFMWPHNSCALFMLTFILQSTPVEVTSCVGNSRLTYLAR